METIQVNREALRQVLKALVGPEYLIRELLVIHSLSSKGFGMNDASDPVGKLIEDYNREVEAYNLAGGEKNE